jgi:hypothetical protein
MRRTTLSEDEIRGQLIAVDGGMGLMDPGPLAIQQPELQAQAP